MISTQNMYLSLIRKLCFCISRCHGTSYSGNYVFPPLFRELLKNWSQHEPASVIFVVPYIEVLL